MAPSSLLVVDDNEFARRTLVRFLEEGGFNVTASADGAEALHRLADQRYDLVLLDLNMPGISGLEVLKNLREIYSPGDLPVIIVTGNKRSEETVEAFDLGANDYVTKPIDFPQLVVRINSQLELRAPEISPFARIEPGTVVGGTYRLEKVIGKGRFGAVYRATHLKLHRSVAIKLLRADFHEDSDALARFEIEGISACRIQHPNAVSVLDFNVTPTGVPYLVLELLEGRSLAEELLVAGQLAPQRCVELAAPVCEVLAEAHALEIIHRDVKPQNIFLHRSRRGEVVKVLDFGIAKMLGESFGHDEVTLEGSTPGTPTYMSPERLSNQPYDGRSDVYSLGIMLYVMLAGRAPFESPNPIKVAMMHIYDKPKRLRRLRRDLPRTLEEVVQTTLEKQPDDRPTAAELGRELRAAVAAAA